MASAFPLAEKSAARHRAGAQAGAAAEAQARHFAERSSDTVLINPRQLEANARSALYPELKGKAEFRATHGTDAERRQAALELSIMAKFANGKLQLRDVDYASVSIDADGTMRTLDDDGTMRILKGLEIVVKTPALEAARDAVYVDQLGMEKKAKRDADAAAWRKDRAAGINPAHKFGKHTDLHPQPVVPTNHTYTTTSPTDAA